MIITTTSKAAAHFDDFDSEDVRQFTLRQIIDSLNRFKSFKPNLNPEEHAAISKAIGTENYTCVHGGDALTICKYRGRFFRRKYHIFHVDDIEELVRTQ